MNQRSYRWKQCGCGKKCYFNDNFRRFCGNDIRYSTRKIFQRRYQKKDHIWYIPIFESDGNGKLLPPSKTNWQSINVPDIIPEVVELKG